MLNPFPELLVSAILILIALVIAIVLIYLRLRQKKSPLPGRMMAPVNRMSRHFGHSGWSDEETPPPPYPGTKGMNNTGFSGVVVEKKQGQGTVSVHWIWHIFISVISCPILLHSTSFCSTTNPHPCN
jgi:hypothetical protein